MSARSSGCAMASSSLIAEARRRLVERGRSRAGEALHGSGPERVMTILVIGNATVDLSFEGRPPAPAGRDAAGEFEDDRCRRQGPSTRRSSPTAPAPMCPMSQRSARTRRARWSPAGCSNEEMDIAHLQRRKGATDQSIIYLDPGREQHRPAASMAASLGTLDAEVPLAALGPGDLLLMQGNLGLETTQGCLERAPPAGCPHAAQSGADRLRLRGAVAAGRCRHRQRDRGRILAGAQSPARRRRGCCRSAPAPSL